MLAAIVGDQGALIQSFFWMLFLHENGENLSVKFCRTRDCDPNYLKLQSQIKIDALINEVTVSRILSSQRKWGDISGPYTAPKFWAKSKLHMQCFACIHVNTCCLLRLLVKVALLLEFNNLKAKFQFYENDIWVLQSVVLFNNVMNAWKAAEQTA